MGDRRCAGEAAVINQSQVSVANGKHAIRQGVTGTVVTNDEAEKPPQLRVTYGEDSMESDHHSPARVETHTAEA